MSEPQEELCFCPTFNSYSSDNLAETAARVAADDSAAEISLNVLRGGDGDSDEFEFSLVCDGAEIFYDGQFGPIFPIFNRDPVAAGDRENDRTGGQEGNPIPSLKDLFLQERGEREEAPSSCSSSEVDETEALAPGTYCVWRPKIMESSPSICKKSNSTGSAASSSSSKRWKFMNLLRRSNSEGKDTYVFLTPKPQAKDKAIVKAVPKTKAAASAASPSRTSAHEAFYVHNRAIRQGDKKKSYLPYRKDLVGFFANVNGLGRSFPAF